MKQKEKKELHLKTIDELAKQVFELRNQLFSSRMDSTKNKLKDTASLTKIRKNIARALTLMKQKEREIQYGKNA